MRIEEIKTIFDYNFWAFNRVWNCITELTDEQFVEEIGYSTGSIRNMILHVMGANRTWIHVLRGMEIPPRLAVEELNSCSRTRLKWDELQKEFSDNLTCMTQEDLEGTIQWQLFSREMKSANFRWEILLHLANHATDHRAQILALLHQHFHLDTVEQDMIIYFAERYNNQLLSTGDKETT